MCDAGKTVKALGETENKSLEFYVTKGLENNPCAAGIRQRVFVAEQGFVNEFDETDKNAFHGTLFVNGRAASTVRLFEEDNGWHIGRIAVLPEFRKTGLGAETVKRAEELAREMKIEKLSLSAQLRVKEFYERLGYKAEGDVYYDECCPHILMTKTL